eukprot:scaffold5377_cov63-Cylindrotheca_fusiformis.AAC.2
MDRVIRSGADKSDVKDVHSDVLRTDQDSMSTQTNPPFEVCSLTPATTSKEPYAWRPRCISYSESPGVWHQPA